MFGPIADVAREKLSREEPDVFELASEHGSHFIICYPWNNSQQYAHTV